MFTRRDPKTVEIPKATVFSRLKLLRNEPFEYNSLLFTFNANSIVKNYNEVTLYFKGDLNLSQIAC